MYSFKDFYVGKDRIDKIFRGVTFTSSVLGLASSLWCIVEGVQGIKEARNETQKNAHSTC